MPLPALDVDTQSLTIPIPLPIPYQVTQGVNEELHPYPEHEDDT